MTNGNCGLHDTTDHPELTTFDTTDPFQDHWQIGAGMGMDWLL